LPQLRSKRGASIATSEEVQPTGAGRVDTSDAPCHKLKPGPGRPAREVARHQRRRIHIAMVEAVAEHGYAAVTVRELADRAGVSTRTFYQHYESKQDCFWGVHQLIVRRLLRGVRSAQAGASDREERLRRSVQAMAGEWGRNPEAARLMLVDACMAGPEATMRARKGMRLVGASISHPHGGSNGPVVAGAVIAGLAGVFRARLLTEEGPTLTGLGERLSQWVVSLQDPATRQFEELDLGADPFAGKTFPQTPSSEMGEHGASAVGGDRALLLSAVAKLCTAEGCGSFTAERITAAAGVSRRRFSSHFADVEDAFVQAMDWHAHDAILMSRHAASNGRSPVGAVYQIVATLCTMVAGNSAFSPLCIGDFADAGLRIMRRRERFRSEVTALIEVYRPPIGRNDSLFLEASVAGLFGVLQNELHMSRKAQAPRLTGKLVHLLLAPVMGTPGAARALRMEAA
jgi:AcrR family transcriptional regulator